MLTTPTPAVHTSRCRDREQQEAVSRWRDAAPAAPLPDLAGSARRCGAVNPTVQAYAVSRVCQRLAEAEAAIHRGEFTAAVVLIRVAADSATRAVIGRNCELKIFSELLAIEAGVSCRILKRLRVYREAANTIVHGYRNARRREAVGLLRMFRVIGTRWAQRNGYQPQVLQEEGGVA